MPTGRPPEVATVCLDVESAIENVDRVIAGIGYIFNEADCGARIETLPVVAGIVNYSEHGRRL
jgi:hypothetical protein